MKNEIRHNEEDPTQNNNNNNKSLKKLCQLSSALSRKCPLRNDSASSISNKRTNSPNQSGTEVFVMTQNKFQHQTRESRRRCLRKTQSVGSLETSMQSNLSGKSWRAAHAGDICDTPMSGHANQQQIEENHLKDSNTEESLPKNITKSMETMDEIGSDFPQLGLRGQRANKESVHTSESCLKDKKNTNGYQPNESKTPRQPPVKQRTKSGSAGDICLRQIFAELDAFDGLHSGKFEQKIEDDNNAEKKSPCADIEVKEHKSDSAINAMPGSSSFSGLSTSPSSEKDTVARRRGKAIRKRRDGTPGLSGRTVSEPRLRVNYLPTHLFAEEKNELLSSSSKSIKNKRRSTEPVLSLPTNRDTEKRLASQAKAQASNSLEVRIRELMAENPSRTLRYSDLLGMSNHDNHVSSKANRRATLGTSSEYTAPSEDSLLRTSSLRRASLGASIHTPITYDIYFNHLSKGNGSLAADNENKHGTCGTSSSSPNIEKKQGGLSTVEFGGRKSAMLQRSHSLSSINGVDAKAAPRSGSVLLPPLEGVSESEDDQSIDLRPAAALTTPNRRHCSFRGHSKSGSSKKSQTQKLKTKNNVELYVEVAGESFSSLYGSGKESDAGRHRTLDEVSIDSGITGLLSLEQHQTVA